MTKKYKYKHIYGPVSSWRLGSSLGIDPLSTKEKICTFNCIYCQLGRAGKLTKERKVYVDCGEIMREIQKLPYVNIDYITFSGMGEPTLAKNLGLMIKAARENRREKIAVMTNGSLLSREDVRMDLINADMVAVKFDAYSQEILQKIDRPLKGINFSKILGGIKTFRKEYGGKLALQMMFIRENTGDISRLAELTREIGPDEIHINTPLRPMGVKPLSREEIFKICKQFKGMNVLSVYGKEKREIVPLDKNDTLRRRGKKL
jgi:wyosine [tRNA(Phe)-imidazoG37] synthetase (radical SAM superfamily)